jgi:hypothetical protein
LRTPFEIVPKNWEKETNENISKPMLKIMKTMVRL